MNDTIKGKYRLVREIARSNDIVYEAMDTSLQRRIALKELNIAPGMTGQAKRERVERFEREARAAGKLSHANIVHVYDHWEENGRYFIAMEYLEGQNLRDLMQMRRGPLPLKEAIDIAAQMLSALAHAHANKVIHRDIKPDNIHILPGGVVKLTDFGIARLSEEPALTSNGQVFGTPSYMSPEQIEGKHIDHRSDLFSLGVLLYEMLAGRKPFQGDSVISITYAIMNAEAPPLIGIPQGVEQVIRRALAKRPDQRQISADQMRQDLLYAEQTPAVFLQSNNQTGMNLRQTGMGMGPGNGANYPNANMGGMSQPMSGMGGYGGQNTGYQNTGFGYPGAQQGANYGGMTNQPSALPDPQAGPNAQPWAWNTAGANMTRAQMKAARRAAQQTGNQPPTAQQLAAYYAQYGQYPTPNTQYPTPGAPGMSPYAAPPFPARPREPLIVLSPAARSNLMAVLAAVVIGSVLAFGIVGFMNRYQAHRESAFTEQVHEQWNRGTEAFNKQDYAGAAALFEQALQKALTPDDVKGLKTNLDVTYVQLAQQAKGQGKLQDAANDYNKALGYNPDDAAAKQGLSILKESAANAPAGSAALSGGNVAPAPMVAPPALSSTPTPVVPAVDPDQHNKDVQAEAQRLIAEGDRLYKSGDVSGARNKWSDARDKAPGFAEHDIAVERLDNYGAPHSE